MQLKTAFRQLRKQRLQTIINLLGLTVGLTGALVIFVGLRYEWSFDQQHSEADQIYRVVQHTQMEGSVEHWNTTAYPLAAAMRQDFPGIEVTQTAGPFSRIISSEDQAGNIVRFREDRILFVDGDYLRLFDFSRHFGDPGSIWLQGNLESAFSDPDAVVLTETLANRYFQDAVARGESLIGRTLLLNNKDPLTVSGVLRNPPANTSLLFDMLVPYEFFRKNNPYFAGNWSGNYRGTTFLKFPDRKTDIAAWETRIAAWQKNYLKPEDDQRISYHLQAVDEIHTETLYGNSPGSYTSSSSLLWVLAGMGLILLLIAVFNFINLATAQIAQRSKEVGVRKVLGGTNWQLRRQFLSETFLLTLVAGLISLVLTQFLLRRLNTWMDIVNLELQTGWELWAATALLILMIALLAGTYPAVVMSRFSPVTALKKQAEERQSKGVNLRRVLIVSQFGIVQLLVVATLVIAYQMKYMRSKDLGFRQDAIVTVDIPQQDSVKLATLHQRLQTMPAIRKMSFASGPPTTHDVAYGTTYRLREEEVGRARNAEMKVVDLSYLDLYELDMVAGKWLGRAQVSDRFNGFVINETAARELGLDPENAVGKNVVINEGEAPVIGVIRDFHNNSLQDAITPCILMYWGSSFFSELHLQVSPQGAPLETTLSGIESIWRDVFPDRIYNYQFLSETLARNYAVERLTFRAFSAVALLAIFVGCIGLFGLVSFLNEKRNKEIGIRKVLGASIAQIASLLSREMLGLILLALVLASPVAYFAMRRWLDEFAYPIDMEWYYFVAAGLSAVLIAALTVGLKIWSAARMNPVESLKNE
ncbi:FtsX-like permease family protein [Flavilitoribacter nigricans]|nr:FtsX-like permease family protein [Flavilitoribacter nigricans]